MKPMAVMLILLIYVACTHPRVKRYDALLKHRIGSAKKFEVNKFLGNPVSCKADSEKFQVCEYRTVAARNDPVPDAYRKQEGMGPDLSPYDPYDVLNLTYDSEEVLRSWEPVVIAQ